MLLAPFRALFIKSVTVYFVCHDGFVSINTIPIPQRCQSMRVLERILHSCTHYRTILRICLLSAHTAFWIHSYMTQRCQSMQVLERILHSCTHYRTLLRICFLSAHTAFWIHSYLTQRCQSMRVLERILHSCTHYRTLLRICLLSAHTAFWTHSYLTQRYQSARIFGGFLCVHIRMRLFWIYFLKCTMGFWHSFICDWTLSNCSGSWKGSSLRAYYTGWRRLIGSLKLQVIFRKRATNYRALLWKITYKDNASCDSTPPCRTLLRIMSCECTQGFLNSFICDGFLHFTNTIKCALSI